MKAGQMNEQIYIESTEEDEKGNTIFWLNGDKPFRMGVIVHGPANIASQEMAESVVLALSMYQDFG